MFPARRKEIREQRDPRKWYVKATKNKTDFTISNGFMSCKKLHFAV